MTEKGRSLLDADDDIFNDNEVIIDYLKKVDSAKTGLGQSFTFCSDQKIYKNHICTDIGNIRT